MKPLSDKENLKIPSFLPELKGDLQRIIKKPENLIETINSAGAPLAISFPDEAKSAAQEFQNLLRDLSIGGQVYAAHKATNSLASLKSLKGVCRIDVASLTELDNVLSVGFAPNEIIATGPKNNAFLAKLIENGITISVDGVEELKRIQSLLDASGGRQSILLRLSRSMLNMPGVTRTSRFGHDMMRYNESLDIIKQDNRFDLLGLGYHIDTVSSEEKYYAVKQALSLLLELQLDGFDAYVLDIGGGFGADYGVSREKIDELNSHLKLNNSLGHLNATWQGFSYGLSNGQGVLRGIDMASDDIGVLRLRSILERTDDSGTTLAQILNENLIELWIEPGAAIFSSSGAVAALVIEVKKIDGETIVVIDAHRNQVCFENNEAPSDPVIVSQDKNKTECDVFIAGNLCMESDFISYRKIHLPSQPKVGDVLLFTHTGAYRSHFSASSSIGQPLAKQVVYEQTGDDYTLKEFGE